MNDNLEVIAAGSGGLALMLTDIELGLKCLIGIVTLGYLIYKWIKEIRK
jgi:hypothetical protein